VNKHNQLPQDYIPEDLEEINPDCSIPGLVLRHTARIAFEKMCSSANQSGIILKAISTFRCYTYQKEVYFRKKTPDMSMEEYEKERDKVSARPGHSEHQTGLAVDINDLEESFEQTPEGKWLAANSFQYGYILRYPKGKEQITGYNYEPWHFRYVGLELARAIYSSGLTYDEYYARYLQLYLQCNQ
jgi:D-alanyl-D-alanine carboxypeptidase